MMYFLDFCFKSGFQIHSTNNAVEPVQIHSGLLNLLNSLTEQIEDIAYESNFQNTEIM